MLISFFISSTFPTQKITEFCHQKLNWSVDNILIKNFTELWELYENKEEKHLIHYQKHEGEFDVYYEIHTKDKAYQNIESQVDFLSEFCQKYQLRILVEEETLDPYVYLLMDEKGFCSTIELDAEAFNRAEESAIDFGGYYNLCFGQFALKKELDIKELKEKLNSFFKPYFSEFRLDYYTKGPVINGDFDKNKLQIQALKDYNYHYSIHPLGKQKWYSKRQKVLLFIALMKHFGDKYNLDICLFPANYSEVKNIKGGSDSEEYCIHYRNGNAEKIIYKYRRKSW